MPEIIRPGNSTDSYQTQYYNVTCRGCQAIVRYRGDEGTKALGTPGQGLMLRFECPCCGHSNVVPAGPVHREAQPFDPNASPYFLRTDHNPNEHKPTSICGTPD